MNLMNAHVLGTAVINVTANTKGLEYALSDTRKQMNGFLTFAGGFGGRLGGAIGSLYGTMIHGGGGGLQSVANAINNAKTQHAASLAAWQGQMPQRSAFQTYRNGFPGVFNSQGYGAAMGSWKSQKPNLAQMQQQAVQAAAVSAGKAALVVAAVVGGLELLARGLKYAAESASEYTEAVAKSEQVFGSHKGLIGAQADTLASKYGVSKRETHELSSSSGLLLQGAGIDEKSSARMGANLAKLAAEASSFYNVPVAEAMRRIQSGLSGMARPLRQFGVMITEAKVNAKAFEMGLVGVDGVVTDGAKTLARYALITQGLSRAIGDIERSQDRYSMQIRMLQGNFENLAASLGQLVLPVFVDLSQKLNDLIGLTKSFVDRLNEGVQAGKVLWKLATGSTHADLAREDAEKMNADLAIDKRNAENVKEQLQLDAETAAMKGGGHKGAGYTDLEGLNKQIQEAVSGGKNAAIRDQTEIAKLALEQQKRQTAALQKLASQQFKNNKGMPF